MARDLVSIVKEKMIEYYAGDSRRVHHFLKVHSFAKLIAEMEAWSPTRCRSWRSQHLPTI
ncbi:hypothetical protein [Coprococcus sp. OM06-25]|uniref:hypothetical protein n=1 Tax=Coprococcus sp. OM06-25 TaxID=2293094 RepID=UPI002E8DE584